MYTDNNPLTYVLMMTKLDAASHLWVASLANYNFWVILLSWKDQHRCRCLVEGVLARVLAWQLRYSPAAVQAAALKGLTSPIEAYSCNLHILDSVQDSQQVACMTLEDWHQAQQVDPTLSLVISRLQDQTLG